MENKEQLRFENIVKLLQLETRYLVTKEFNKMEHDMVISVSPFTQEEVEILKQEALKLINIK